jgi:hypothetical protein
MPEIAVLPASWRSLPWLIVLSGLVFPSLATSVYQSGKNVIGNLSRLTKNIRAQRALAKSEATDRRSGCRFIFISVRAARDDAVTLKMFSPGAR